MQLAQLVNGNFAFGEYLHTLRLASELADLRVADANPIRAITHEAGREYVALRTLQALGASGSILQIAKSKDRAFCLRRGTIEKLKRGEMPF